MVKNNQMIKLIISEDHPFLSPMENKNTDNPKVLEKGNFKLDR